MKNKIIYSHFDEDTGISTVTIQNKYGHFSGQARLHPDDENRVSTFAGCRYAEIRANIKCLKVQLKEVKNQLHIFECYFKELKNKDNFNPNNYEIKVAKSFIKQLHKRQQSIEADIAECQQKIKIFDKERTEILKRTKYIKSPK